MLIMALLTEPWQLQSPASKLLLPPPPDHPVTGVKINVMTKAAAASAKRYGRLLKFTGH
jgi:hypothetical protein